MKIDNERRKCHIKDLHIQDIQLIYDGHDSKVQERSYDAERKYYVLKLKKCYRLLRLHLRNHMMPTCEWNYKDGCKHYWKGNFIDMMFGRPILQDEGDNLMVVLNDIHR